MTNKLLFVNIIDPDDIKIESLSFSTCGKYLAASYSNNVAIFEVRTNFLITTLSDNCPDASFRTILWIPPKNLENVNLSDYRLFTVGLHGIITEWDLKLFKAKNSCMSYGGAIFAGSFAANSDLLVACDDGSVRSFSIWDDHKSMDRIPELNFNKVQVRHNKRILSIYCIPDGRFFCGTSDSLILICDIDKDNYFNIIRVTSRNKTKRIQKEGEENKEENAKEEDNTHIWCLEYIEKHNTLASGDSNGNVILWDLSTLTMLQTFTQHNRDVLSLALLNQDTLFSAGVDSKVTMYTNNLSGNEYINDPEFYLNTGLKDIETYLKNKSREGWSINGFKYPLKGDIRTMCISPSQGYTATGGNMGCISICKGIKFMSNRKSKYKLMYPNLSPFNPSVSMNKKKNLAICRYEYHCDLWYLPGNERSNKDNLNKIPEIEELEGKKTKEIMESDNPYKLLTIKTKDNKGKIRICCLSPEGDSVAIANQQGLRIFEWNLKDLKIKQKYENSEIYVLSMAFWSNSELIVNHFDKKYLVSLCNLKNYNMTNLDFLDFNKHVIKVTLHSKKLQKPINYDEYEYNKGDKTAEVNINGNKSKNHTEESSPNTEEDPGWGVFYTLEGAVYVSDFSKKRYTKLPQLEGGSRVCTMAFSNDCEYLVAFSTSFKYYFYDLVRGRMMEHQGRFIHPVDNKKVNLNSMIANCFWHGNNIIVHTTHNIFYFKLTSPPFQNTHPFEIGTEETQCTNTDTPLKKKNSLLEDKETEKPFLNGIWERRSQFTEKKVVLGPRRLYQVPSIENLNYNELLKNSTESVYSQLSKESNHILDQEGETPKSKDSNPSLETPRGNQSNTSFESGASNEFNSSDETPKLTEQNKLSEMTEFVESPKFIYLDDSEESPKPSKLSEATDKGTTNQITILKSKFILHCDFLVRDSRTVIIAFRTPSKEEVARKKTYGN